MVGSLLNSTLCGISVCFWGNSFVIEGRENFAVHSSYLWIVRRLGGFCGPVCILFFIFLFFLARLSLRYVVAKRYWVCFVLGRGAHLLWLGFGFALCELIPLRCSGSLRVKFLFAYFNSAREFNCICSSAMVLQCSAGLMDFVHFFWAEGEPTVGFIKYI